MVHAIRAAWAVLLVSVASCVSATANPPGAQNVLDGAAANLRSGNYQAAAAMLEAAAERWPGNPEIWNLLGVAQGELHRTTEARAAFEHGLRIAPNAVALYENIGLLFYRDQHYRKAKTFLARAVALGSDKPGVRFSLAASRLRTGEAQRALYDLQKLEPQFGNVAAYWDERGRAESWQDPAAAEKSFSRALALQPDDLSALNGAASAAERQHLDEKALAYLIRARQTDPNDVPTLAHFGSVCIRRDLGLDALGALQKAHRLDPSSSSILFLLARANVSLSNWQTAYDLFSEYSKRVPSYAPVYYAMGWIDTKLDHTADARRQLRHCLALDPKLTDARFALAQLELDDGNVATARQLLSELLRANQHNAKANLAMGDLLLRQGDLSRAESCLESAIRQDPKLAAAHYKLSLLYSRKHDLKKAESERAISAQLNADANRASKTQLKLILPENGFAQ